MYILLHMVWTRSLCRIKYILFHILWYTFWDTFFLFLSLLYVGCNFWRLCSVKIVRICRIILLYDLPNCFQIITFVHHRVEMYYWCCSLCIYLRWNKDNTYEFIVSGIRNHQGRDFLLSFLWEFFLCFCLSLLCYLYILFISLCVLS